VVGRSRLWLQQNYPQVQCDQCQLNNGWSYFPQVPAVQQGVPAATLPTQHHPCR
jgi:hypothetical protein